MDRPDPIAMPTDRSPVDEAALEAFIRSEGFDQFLLDCFAEGVREAVAEQRALGLNHEAAS